MFFFKPVPRPWACVPHLAVPVDGVQKRRTLMRRFLKLFAALGAVWAVGLASPAYAGVPKVVFAEEFGATW